MPFFSFAKKSSVSDNTTDTGETVSGKQNDTATLQNTALSSDSKDTANNSTDQINSEENLQQPTVEPAPTAADLAAETTAPSVSNKQTTTTEPAQVKAEKTTASAPKVQTKTAENAQDDIMTFDKANE